MPDVTASETEQSAQVPTIARDRRSRAIYVGAVAVLGVLLAIQAWQGGFGLDVYLHLSVLRELAARPLEPLNPFVASTDLTFGFSPYTVGLGLVGWISGVGPVTLLHLGAALNLVLLASGFWMFSRCFSSYRWTPHLTLFFSLLGWGLFSWRWSGYWNLNSIGFGLGYPAMFASGLALIALAGLWRYFSNTRWTILAGVSIAMAVVTLTHPVTGFWLGIAALALTIGQPAKVLRTTAVGLLVGAGLTVAIVLAWPYYSFFDQWALASDHSTAHDPLYRSVLARAFLLLPGVVALVYRARKRLLDPLVLMFFAGTAVYFLGYVGGFHSLGRVMPLIALSAHTALADLIAGWLTKSSQRRLAIATIAVIGTVGFVGSFPAVFWMIPRSVVPASALGIDDFDEEISPYRSLNAVLDPAGIAFASPKMSMVLPSVTGRVVVPGYLTPMLSDRSERDRAGAAFFSPTLTVAERTSIAAEWGASHIVVEPDYLAAHPWLEHDFSVVAATDAYVVLRISPDGDDP